MKTYKLSRREFLTYAGVSSSGLLLGCSAVSSKSSAIKFSPQQNIESQKLNIFVAIKTDNTVEIVSHRVEMGQGSKTGIPQIIADELEASWSNVQVIQGEGNKAYGNQNTDGSSSIRKFYDKLREMGASARTMLEQAAADYWQVPVNEVYAKENKIINKKTGHSFTYGELAELASHQNIPDVNALHYKTAKHFNYIGKSVPIVDLNDIITGNTVYGIDVDLPQMLIASIERCPVLHGQVKSFDATAALKISGVVDVIQMPPTPTTVVYNPLAGVAVLATNTWAAQQGRKAMVIEWELGENKSHDSAIAFDTFKDNIFITDKDGYLPAHNQWRSALPITIEAKGFTFPTEADHAWTTVCELEDEVADVAELFTDAQPTIDMTAEELTKTHAHESAEDRIARALVARGHEEHDAPDAETRARIVLLRMQARMAKLRATMRPEDLAEIEHLTEERRR